MCQGVAVHRVIHSLSSGHEDSARALFVVDQFPQRRKQLVNMSISAKFALYRDQVFLFSDNDIKLMMNP